MSKKLGGAPEEYKKEGSGKKKGRLAWVVIVIAAVVLVFSLVNIIGIGSDWFATDQAYHGLKEIAMPSADAQQDAPGSPLDRTIDFDALRAVNEDIIGWIYMPNTRIDYPLVIGEDNDYYISHNANKESDRAGAIFLDEQNSPDFSDQNTIIYGHRMNSGAMFADLHKYQDEAFFRENDIIYLYLPDGTVSEYRIFSAYVVNEVDETYTIGFASEDDYASYLEKMKGRSGVETDIELSPQDRIITLSTCVKGQDTDRYVVQAVLQK